MNSKQENGRLGEKWEEKQNKYNEREEETEGNETKQRQRSEIGMREGG